MEVADFVQMLEKRQEINISTLEEIVYRYEWIAQEGFLKLEKKYRKNPYEQRFKAIDEGKVRR